MTTTLQGIHKWHCLPSDNRKRAGGKQGPMQRAGLDWCRRGGTGLGCVGSEHQWHCSGLHSLWREKTCWTEAKEIWEVSPLSSFRFLGSSFERAVTFSLSHLNHKNDWERKAWLYDSLHCHQLWIEEILEARSHVSGSWSFLSCVQSSTAVHQSFLSFFSLINFYCSVVALQCYVSFYCTAEWLSHLAPLLDFLPI